MKFENAFFIIGTAYAGKSTMVKLLAERYNGIACEENCHNALLPELDQDEFPNLTYTGNLQDWHDFIRRTLGEYDNWIQGSSKECETLELQILSRLNQEGKIVFVGTNIKVETLKKIGQGSRAGYVSGSRRIRKPLF